MATLMRGTQLLGLFLENGSRILNISSRCLSTAVRSKIKVGSNGEKIITSPYGEAVFPSMPIPEFVWQDVEKYPNRTALECGITGRKYTYAEARDASNYVARSLINMGLKPNDVIALVLPNLPECAIAFLGALEAGLVVTTVNSLYTVDEVARQLKSSGAKGVVTATEVAATVLAAAKISFEPGAPCIVVDDGTGPVPEGTIPFQDLITKGKTLPPVPSRPWTSDDLAVLPYSSGTTGLPKGVMLSHKNIVSNITQVEFSADGDAWKRTTDSYQEVIPVVLPLFHIYGINAIMLPRLTIGAKLVTIPKFTPETFVNVLDKHKPTLLYLVPPIVLFLTLSPAVRARHLEAVHCAFSGAAPLGQADVDRFYDKFKIDRARLRFFQGYGLTETSPVTFMQTGDTNKFASIGSPVSNCEARLVDHVTKEDVGEPNRTGEIWVRGPHVMKGYFNNEEATKEMLLPGGWLRTGDLAYFDEDMHFFITDRLKELIKVKGFQVPPAELEELLRTHPDILEAGVVGIPDERCGELPKAFVVLKKDRNPSEEDIKNFIKDKVTEYKQLKGGVTFIDDIPKNSTGKILRTKLKMDFINQK